MKIYKYVEILEPDCYYDEPDEEILFYCNDKNKNNKIKDYLISVINEHRLWESKEFFEHKSNYNARIFYDFKKNILGLISDKNEYFILENALILNTPEHFFTSCHKGHHQFYICNKNNENYIHTSLKVSVKKFYSYNLPECEYFRGERYLEAKTPLKQMMHFANYNLFEKDILKTLSSLEYDLEIKKIEENYKLIEIKIN